MTIGVEYQQSQSTNGNGNHPVRENFVVGSFYQQDATHVFSLDGDRVALQSDPNGGGEVKISRPDGKNQIGLVNIHLGVNQYITHKDVVFRGLPKATEPSVTSESKLAARAKLLFHR